MPTLNFERLARIINETNGWGNLTAADAKAEFEAAAERDLPLMDLRVGHASIPRFEALGLRTTIYTHNGSMYDEERVSVWAEVRS